MNMPVEPHLPILLVTGLAIVLGTLGADLFQRLRIPRVVGYVLIGVVLGGAGFNVLDSQSLASLAPVNRFALGIIGLMIGGELHRDVLRKHGQRLLAILLAEGIACFVLVFIVAGGLFYLITGHVMAALSAGLILGAIAPATAPASTVGVLWEYKARGPLTTTVYGVVALDAGLALVLFAFASSLVAVLLQTATTPLQQALLLATYQLGGAVVLGVLAGLGLNYAIRHAYERGKVIAMIFGSVALLIGTSMLLRVDMILANMALGATLANLAPRRSHPAFDLLASFSDPIYALFFVIVGARLDVFDMHAWIWLLALLYALARMTGKLLGVYLGARATKASRTVRNYLGLCLSSQCGMAIGLAVLAADQFDTFDAYAGIPLTSTIIAVITASAFLSQLIGPACVKMALTKAGEAGLNITEEDLAKSYRVRDVMEEATAFHEGTTLSEVLDTIASTEAAAYPVLDEEGALSGVISIEDFRKSFRAQRLSNWLVAYDLMQVSPGETAEAVPLPDAMKKMLELGLDYLPVLGGPGNRKLVGILQRRPVARFLASEVLRRRSLADE